jgi:adenosyl cobinamide kinase/adenosyl cobinamide phosphate guanylyltransferase
MITHFLGGARSGKSAAAERRVLSHDGRVLYVATGVVTDDDMRHRVQRHRDRRDPRFDTIEADADLAGTLRALPDAPALVDALGTWVARHHDFAVDIDGVVDALAQRSSRGAPTVIVSEEVGLGVHPETAVGRAFRDALGIVNQRVAAVADQAYLVVAGRLLPLDRLDG